ncbi:hypothetical protein B296_00019547 [Ensete ventricosum]|uniref:Uncharacterized protein n=1 Tax=Ensete ventricosum TaxID=4639 RepID=A0A426ZFW7_ENSVE|nr:hypothetical protein B296_00019547 [Ensete ventricosum]
MAFFHWTTSGKHNRSCPPIGQMWGFPEKSPAGKKHVAEVMVTTPATKRGSEPSGGAWGPERFSAESASPMTPLDATCHDPFRGSSAPQAVCGLLVGRLVNLGEKEIIQ